MQQRYFLALALLPCLSPASYGQSMEDVPGVVISHIPAPSFWDQVFGRARYVSDPAIAVLPNGDYLASHARFNPSSNIVSTGPTEVFRSTDGGQSWTRVADLDGMVRASPFELNGSLYLIGANSDGSGNEAVIFRSLDGGQSWQANELGFGGMATPDNAIAFAGHLWLARTRSSLRLPLVADPFSSASWSAGSGFPSLSDDWLPGSGYESNFIGEGQITASPHEGLAILPKVRLLPYLAVARVHPSNGRVVFDPDHDFVRMEGGEKKFGVRYDEVSEKYYMLSNPILPAHYGSSLAIDLIRNTAAVMSSKDLRNWRLEQIFLYSPNINYEGFQYFNFDIDGDDLVVASRTAFDVGGNRPPRGHDANLLTFHRIEDFRNLSREQVLRIEGGDVQRYEKTQHADAPLGTFPLGNLFEGAPLSNPIAFGTDNGAVYIQEDGGRILRFDPFGNFLGSVSTPPVPLQTSELELPQPSTNKMTWTSGSSGEWNNPRNWHDWNRPGSEEDVAIFGSASSAPATISIPSTARHWRFKEAGNFEGWTTHNVINESVGDGLLRGTAENHSPQLSRMNQNFMGSQAPEVRVRMRANTSSSPVDLFWGTWTDDTFSATRHLRLEYTGDGEFQEIIFPMEGITDWDGERITRIRIDPLKGEQHAGVDFEIDSISITTESDHLRLGALRFQSSHAHTIEGSGSIRLGTDNGLARIDVKMGEHRIQVPLSLATDTEILVDDNSALAMSPAPSLYESILHLRGNGTVQAVQWTISSGSTLRLAESVHVEVDDALHLADGAHLSIEGGQIITTQLTLPEEGEAVITLPIIQGSSPLQVNGDLQLGDEITLALSIPPDFEADRDDTFPLIEFSGNRSGSFRNKDEGAVVEAGGHLFSLHYDINPGMIGLQYLGISFQKWIEGFSVPENQTGPDQDPAGDRIPNLIKYVRGLSPLKPVGSRMVWQERVQVIGDIPYLILEMPRNPKAPQHSVQVLVSENLIDWEERPESVEVLVNAPEMLKARLNLANYSRAFLRLKLEMEE